MKTLSTRRTYRPWEDASARPLIAFEGVTKRFGSGPEAVTAVDDLTLHIFEREFFALLGPSGCGKTTLMRMLAGFEEPTSGAILLDGEDIARLPPHRRPVNMMFQSYALFPHMSVADNIAYGLKRQGMGKAERDGRVAEMLSLVKLDAMAARRPDQLSGGQRQRVALARSLARQPRVLLLDEPLGALDRKLREETQFELVDLQERLGITFLIVTHDQEEAMTVADRIAVMRDGRTEQVSPPVDIYERPNSRYVADFLGDVTVVEGKVAQGGDTPTLVTTTGERMSGEAVEPVAEGDTAWLAVRPEKFAIAREDEAAAGGVNRLAGEVWDIAYLGGLTVFKVKLDAGPFAKVSVLNAHVEDAGSPITWEERVVLTCRSADALVLAR